MFQIHSTAGTGGCNLCSSIPPFEISASSKKMTATKNQIVNNMGNIDPDDDSWKRVPNFSIETSGGYAFVTLSKLPIKAKDVNMIRYAWEAAPECSLYDGTGGPDDHSPLPVPPFKIALLK